MGGGASLCAQRDNALSSNTLRILDEGIKRVTLERGEVRQQVDGSDQNLILDVVDPNSYLPRGQDKWVPAVFEIDTAGETSIVSPINGLCMVTDADIYKALCELFDAAVPLLESHLSVNLLGARVQVIVKCQTYRITPFEKYTSRLHKEGKNEAIDAGVLFYTRVDEGLKGGDLQLIRQHDFNTKDMASEEVLEKALVCFPARKNRLLVFNNTDVYHKISDLSVPDLPHFRGKVLERTVVGFFVKANPVTPIPDSLSDVRLNEHLWWPLVVRAWGKQVDRVLPSDVETMIGEYILLPVDEVRDNRERFKRSIRVEPPEFVARIKGKPAYMEWRRRHPCNLD